jgi:heme exporter protein D
MSAWPLLALSVVALLVSCWSVVVARRGALRAEAQARALGLRKVGGRWTGRWIGPDE